MPPGIQPTSSRARFKSRLVTPPLFMRSPASTKKGMHIREKELTPVKRRWVMMDM